MGQVTEVLVKDRREFVTKKAAIEFVENQLDRGFQCGWKIVNGLFLVKVWQCAF